MTIDSSGDRLLIPQKTPIAATPGVNPLPDDRSLLARATEWSFAVMTIGVEMVLPILGGHWLDDWLGIKGVFAILGGILGVSAGLWSLLRMVEPLRRSDDERRRPPPDSLP